MAKTYIKPEKNTFQIEVAKPLIPVENDLSQTDQSRFTNFRCWTGGWERLRAKEAGGMTHMQIARRLLEMSSPDWSFHAMPDDSDVRLIETRSYMLKKNGKEHSEYTTVFETRLGLLRQLSDGETGQSKICNTSSQGGE
jgi:hypothetical protein